MKLLLDTHVFLGWITDDPRLDSGARALLANPTNSLVWSVASTWEVATKHALGKLPLPVSPEDLLPAQRRANGVELLAVGEAHALESARLPRHHADPFDRLLIAQARCEGLALLSFDAIFHQYDVRLLRS